MMLSLEELWRDVTHGRADLQQVSVQESRQYSRGSIKVLEERLDAEGRNWKLKDGMEKFKAVFKNEKERVVGIF